jgi:hypothetical protein
MWDTRKAERSVAPKGRLYLPHMWTLSKSLWLSWDRMDVIVCHVLLLIWVGYPCMDNA